MTTKPTTTSENQPLDLDNPKVGQWAWKPRSATTGEAFRIEHVTKTGRVKVRGVEYRRDGREFVHRGAAYGRFGMRDSTYLRPATVEEITIAVELERQETARLEASRLERAAWRRRLNDFDFSTIDDNATWQIARALGWTA